MRNVRGKATEEDKVANLDICDCDDMSLSKMNSEGVWIEKACATIQIDELTM